MKPILSLKKWSLLALAGSLVLLSGKAWAWSSCENDGWYGRASRRGYSWQVYSGVHRPHRHWAYHNVYVTYQPIYPMSASAPVYEETVVINVPNANGSYTPVTLRRQGGTYIGPRGELYMSMPTVDQLRAVYGLQ